MSDDLIKRLEEINLRELSSSSKKSIQDSSSKQPEHQGKKKKTSDALPSDMKKTIRVTLSEASIQRLFALRLSSKYEDLSRSRIIEQAIDNFLSTEENRQILSEISKLIR